MKFYFVPLPELLMRANGLKGGFSRAGGAGLRGDRAKDRANDPAAVGGRVPELL
jgi:hypothetical protein